MINKYFTLEELQEVINKIEEPKKEIHVNIEGYERIVNRLGYEPDNLIRNSFAPENYAFIINKDEIKPKFSLISIID